MAKRPTGVTVVAVIVWIQGLLTAIGGLVLLLGAAGRGAQAAAASTAGIITIILGLITIAVGAALLRGSNGARILTTIVLVISLANAVWTLIVLPFNTWSPVLNGLLALLGIVLLYTRQASAFFNSH